MSIKLRKSQPNLFPGVTLLGNGFSWPSKFLSLSLLGYQRPPLPPLLLLPLPLLLLPLDEPDDREGGDTDDPRELLPDDDRGAALLGLGELGREGRALLPLGCEELGRAGRVLLPEGRLVDEGLVASLDGRRELSEGLTAWPEGRRDVPLRTPSVLREPLGRTVPRVLVRASGLELPRVATVRVEMRPLASRDIAVRVAPRVEVRDVRVFIRSREDERAAIWRLLTTITPG